MLGHSIVFQHFMEPEGSIPNSQELSTCSYPKPDQSSPHHPIPPLRDPSTYVLVFVVVSFPSGFPTNNLYAFLFLPIRATWPAHLILDLIILIILGEEYKSRSSEILPLENEIWIYIFDHPVALSSNGTNCYAYSSVTWIWIGPLNIMKMYHV
jgi:hypothetical protein